jgi:hypothetical protein
MDEKTARFCKTDNYGRILFAKIKVRFSLEIKYNATGTFILPDDPVNTFPPH